MGGRFGGAPSLIGSLEVFAELTSRGVGWELATTTAGSPLGLADQ